MATAVHVGRVRRVNAFAERAELGQRLRDRGDALSIETAERGELLRHAGVVWRGR